MNKTRWSAFLPLRHELVIHLCCVFCRGGNPFATVRLRPTVTNDRSAPVIWSVHISNSKFPVSSTQDVQLSPAFTAQQLLLVWMKPDKTWHRGKKKCHLNLRSPYCCKLMEVFWDHFIYWTDVHIFKIYILYAYFWPSVCGGVIQMTTFLPALEK